MELVLKIIWYLERQGYESNQLVILTPYLGQLRALQMAMTDKDPVLNDLDTFDLIRAGVFSPSSARHKRSSIRLATLGLFLFSCRTLRIMLNLTQRI